MSSLSGLEYWNDDMSTSATLISTGCPSRTTLGTSGSIGVSNATWTTSGINTSSGLGIGTLSMSSVNNGLSWNGGVTSIASPYTNQTTGWGTPYTNQSQALRVEGDAEFKGEVTIRGVKLDERLTAIEERLGILRPNNDLEGKWEKLKALGDEYRALEKDILEKEKIWALLNK